MQDTAEKEQLAAETPQEAQDSDERMLQDRMDQIRSKLLVLSGKGGVGKSTVAANLAIALAQRGRRVGLLDIDVHGPSIPKLMGIRTNPIRAFGRELIPASVNEHLAVMSIGFLLTTERLPVIWRGPLKHRAIRQFLRDVAWGQRDYLVVDSPPGTGDEPLSIAQLVGTGAGAIVVTIPQDVAVADVRRCVEFCHAVSLPVLGIVENMSGLICPKCGEEIDLFKRGGGVALAQEMGVPFLGCIPIDPEVVVSGDAGIPLLREHSQSSAAKAFAHIVDAILAAESRP
jgi:Mrp family chromosome partitioning ATPase